MQVPDSFRSGFQFRNFPSRSGFYMCCGLMSLFALFPSLLSFCNAGACSLLSRVGRVAPPAFVSGANRRARAPFSSPSLPLVFFAVYVFYRESFEDFRPLPPSMPPSAFRLRVSDQSVMPCACHAMPFQVRLLGFGNTAGMNESLRKKRTLKAS